jgi:hypothetical protein
MNRMRPQRSCRWPHYDSDLYGLPMDGVNKALGLMKAVEVDTVRILIPWVAVQHGKDAYDWSLVDRMVDAAVSNRLSIPATLNSPPAWAVHDEVLRTRRSPGLADQPAGGHPAADVGQRRWRKEDLGH